MDCSALHHFRDSLYACFQSAPAALMNAADALLTETAARTFPEISLSPFFPRRWPSLYAAFEDGRADRNALRKLFAVSAPLALTGERPILGIDASSIYRPLAETSQDRTAQYVHNLPGGKAPVKPGWSFSTLVLLPEEPSSWTYLLDNQRIESARTAAEVAAAQLKAIVPLLTQRLAPGTRPLLLGDRHYGSAGFVEQVHGLPLDGLFRLQRHRTFYRAAPQRLPAGQNPRGAPKKDGAKFKCSDPTTHSSPDAYWEGADAKGRPLQVTAWNGLHFQGCREAPLCVIRVVCSKALGTRRDPRISWFVAVGEPPPLSEVARIYRLRFSQEHGYRFDKGSLLWDAPRLRSPEQFQLWTDVVAAVHNQLVLARPVAEALRRPWESRHRAATPQQVRRAMGRIVAELGTPAPRPQPRGKAPGRPKGVCPPPAPRFVVVKKATQRAVSPPRVAKKPPRLNAPPATPVSSSPSTLPAWLIPAIRAAAAVV